MSSPMSSSRDIEIKETPFVYVVKVTFTNLARVWLINHENTNSIKFTSEGSFSTTLVTQKLTPTYMRMFSVGKFHWPLTNNSPIFRIGSRSFIFAFPGLIYGVQFSLNHYDLSTPTIIDDIAGLLRGNPHYEDHRHVIRVSAVNEGTKNFWIEARSQFEDMLFDRLLRNGFSHGRTITGRTMQCCNCVISHYLSNATKALNVCMDAGRLTHWDIELIYQGDGDNAFGDMVLPGLNVFSNVVNAIEFEKRFPNVICPMVRHVGEMVSGDFWMFKEERFTHVMEMLFSIISTFEQEIDSCGMGDMDDDNGDNSSDTDDE